MVHGTWYMVHMVHGTWYMHNVNSNCTCDAVKAYSLKTSQNQPKFEVFKGIQDTDTGYIVQSTLHTHRIQDTG